MEGRSGLGAGVLVCLAAWSSVFAQEQITPSFSKLRDDGSYRNAVFDAAQRTNAWTKNRCDGAKAHILNQIAILAPPVIDDRGAAQSGAWIEHVAVDGCDTHWQLNVLMRVEKPGQLDASPMLPGTSVADPLLQKDGATYAYAAATVDLKTCSSIYIRDTAFLGFSDAKTEAAGKREWSERWRVTQCDRTISVILRFVPDKTGTTIVAKRDPT